MRKAPSALTGFMLLVAAEACVIDELREDDVGDAAWCDAARQWPTAYAELEDELFVALNAVRVRSGQCGEVSQDATGRVELTPELRCAARHHASFLAEHDGVGHEGAESTTPAHRVGFAAYEGLAMYELIARDFVDPHEVIEAWLSNPSHCRAFYRRTIEHVGIGHSRNAAGDKTAWVVVTGRSRS